MPSLKAIRKRIASVKNTKKITAAMKLVAGARLRRAQEGIWAARPYAQRLRELITELAARADIDSVASDELDRPLDLLAEDASQEDRQRFPIIKAAKLLRGRRLEKNVAMVLLTSDRGLCGAFNANVSRRTERFIIDNGDKFDSVVLNIVGKKGREYFKRRKTGTLNREWASPTVSKVALERAREIANEVTADFLAGRVDSVYVVYNEFKSAISQNVTVEPLLPLSQMATDTGEPGEHGYADFKYEPSREAVLAHIVPLHVEVQLYRALLESIASEFGARMSAMDSATKNAKELISSLTLEFNRARQAAITKELMEIVGGAEAIKG